MIEVGAVYRTVATLKTREAKSEYRDNPVKWAKERAGITLWSKQAEIAMSVVHNKDTAVKAGHGTGKAQTLDTMIRTTEGWTTFREISVGDRVYDETGKPTTVTGKSRVWSEPTMRVLFDDGTVEEVHPNHEWNVLDLTRRTATMKRGVRDWRDHWDDTTTVTTQEMFDMGVKTNSNQNRWRIPIAQTLAGAHAELPIDPYLLGFWLGDGCTSNGTISIGRTKAGLFDWLDDNGYTYSHSWHEHKNCWVIAIRGFRGQLRNEGLLGNKHVPNKYLWADEVQRRELLAGWMDADGFTMQKSGADVGMDTTDEDAADDLYDLLMTLGVKVFRSESVSAYTLKNVRHETGTRYRMNWTPLENPFKIRGSNWVAPTTHRSRHTIRNIVSITEGDKKDTVCIEVDSPRHLYLTGQSLIPTHNSFLAAVLIVWWVDTRYPDMFVASTAPSGAQITAIVWREVRKIYNRVNAKAVRDGTDPLPGYITSDNNWKDEAGNLLGFGRKPPDQKTDDAFQGLHDKGGVLAIGDEATGLQEDLIDALGNITSNSVSRRFLICNPTNPASYIGKIFKEKPANWALLTISVFDNPNFTGEDVPDEVKAGLSDETFVEAKRAEYGEGSPRWISRVLGEFAFDMDAALFTDHEFSPAWDVEILPSGERPVLGCDVARFGVDKNVIYLNDAGRVRLHDVWEQTPGTETANRIHRAAIDTGAREVRIDGTGLGGPIVDMVVALCENKYTVIEIKGSAASPDKRQWYNWRAWSFDSVRQKMSSGLLDVALEDEKLAEELGGIQYKFAPSGGLLIESKDDMRKRGVKSPDFADAFVYAALDTSQVIVGEPVGDSFMAEIETVERMWDFV